MKEHKIDKLFRQKLHQHSETPTPAAWNQVASQLKTRRRKRGGYYAAAAAVVLLLSCVWLGLQQKEDPLNNSQHTTIAVNEQVPSPSSSVAVGAGETQDHEEANSPDASKPAASATSAVATASQTASAKSSRVKTQTSKVAKQRNKPLDAAVEMQEGRPESALAQALPELAPATPNSFTAVNEAAVNTTIALPSAENLIASTEQVVIRYNAATIEEDQDNASEKVLSIMKKVKQGEIGLSDIRQAKDNLLSGRFNKP